MCNCNKNTGCGYYQNNWNSCERQCNVQKNQCGCCCQSKEICCPRPEPKCCCYCFEENKGSYNC